MVCRPGHEHDPVEKMRHSCAHVMADAVQQLFPTAKVTIGPVIDDGFFYDFDYSAGFTPDDLKKIEKKMQEIVKKNSKFERKEISKKEAIQFFKEKGENYKVEIVEGLEDGTITLYTHGDFTDLCKGPHVESTREIKAFKLLKVSGAYWRGLETNPMLQRIYGTAFASKDELAKYLHQQEEAKKRDHRKLGVELELFEVNPDIGGGLILWHPNGAQVRITIEDFLRKTLTKAGYQWVMTPHVGRSNLWETSGHLGFYKENMYAKMDVEGQDYYIKPMNCPFHINIYSSKKRSYRELPVRYAEFGTVYRFERSGVLHGLTRVRGFTQDDAHIFCTPEQVDAEIAKCLQEVLSVLRTFGLTEFQAFISTKPEKFVGSEEDWKMSTDALTKAVKSSEINYEIDEGGGVFYGPKIDVKVKDSLGRFWQLSTIQFDFNLPERFQINFQGSDGKMHRPYMVHRALLGSFERFFGILIEHYAGAFPLWLAPVQATILTISDAQIPYGRKILEILLEKGVRVTLDERGEKIGHKIREAQLKKIPYMLVVGDREVAEEKVAVRSRTEGDGGAVTIDEFMKRFEKEERDHQS
ncbi:MAG: threonine--tRNA ligase [Deltaproteobacteria bacterium]|nr:threonine--tRNA ligase [Deltaproteobacteria bacterium]